MNIPVAGASGAHDRRRLKLTVRVVGGISGGISFLALVVVIFILSRRKRTRKEHRRRQHSIISREGISEGRSSRSYGLDPFILPPKSEQEISPSEISTLGSNRRYSIQVQAPVPSVRDGEAGIPGWTDLRREINRPGREIRRNLGDSHSFSRPPPSYVSQQPCRDGECYN